MTLTEIQKYEIIIKYKNGSTITDIANNFKINIKTVILWLNRYCEQGNVNRKTRESDKRITTENDDKVIYEFAEKNKKLKLVTFKNNLKDLDIILSKTTIWRRLKNNEYKYGHFLFKPKLSEKQMQKRLDWALNHKDTDWSKVDFSDECTVYLNGENKYCWYKKGSRPVCHKFRHSVKLNIWAFINLSFGLGDYKIFKENMNKDVYENILTEHMILFHRDESTFQQDNHPVHKSKKIKSFLKDNNIKTLDCPPNSPDLNPIENFWKLVKDKVSLDILTKDNFEEKLKFAIENINIEHIYNMISNMHLRIQKVIDVKGGSINY